jgi:hypothetical protein
LHQEQLLFQLLEMFKYYEVVEPVLQLNGGNIYYLNLSQDAFKLGGSSFNQTQNKIGNETPTIKDACFFKSIQYLTRFN